MHYLKQNPDNVAPKKYWIEYMKENGLCEIELIEAKAVFNSDYFFCSHFGEVGDKKESGCGKMCAAYKPRNGYHGRCCHSKNVYEPTDKTITLKNKTT